MIYADRLDLFAALDQLCTLAEEHAPFELLGAEHTLVAKLRAAARDYRHAALRRRQPRPRCGARLRERDDGSTG